MLLLTSYVFVCRRLVRANLTCLSAQSCHIGEEDEGGEEGGEEPSFEVRQTEMVWGGLGLGPWESAEPTATATAPATH